MTRSRKLLDLALPALAVGLLLGLWMLVYQAKPDIMPTPLAVGKRLWDITIHPISKAILPVHILVSLGRVLGAFALASLFGVTFGILLGWYETFHHIAWPVFEIIRPIPPIAWIPLIILWCGIGETSKIVIVFIGAVVPIVLNTFAGIRQVNPMLIKAARSVGASDRAIMLEAVLPDSLPSIVAGMKTALSTGWMCVLAAEMVVARQGVGFLIIRGMDNGDSALILAGMVVIGVVSALITAALNYLEVKLCPWKETQR
ncbi:MAG: ABC transporter permease [Lachnospiraceae bacterium]|nr:ABC transporter permease [Lachnospiraceae bacterium]